MEGGGSKDYCCKRIYIRHALAVLMLLLVGDLFADSNERVDWSLNLNAGLVGVNSSVDGARRYGFDVRGPALSPLKLQWGAGFARSENGASFTYVDLRRDFWLSSDWVTSVYFGPGLFEESRELKLGSKLEFRSGLGLEYRFTGQYRAGLAVYHLSNGGFADRNPGTEAILLTIGLPFSP